MYLLQAVQQYSGTLLTCFTRILSRVVYRHQSSRHNTRQQRSYSRGKLMRPDHFQFFIVCSYWNKRNESMNRSYTHGEKSDSFNMVAVIKRRHDREPRQVFFSAVYWQLLVSTGFLCLFNLYVNINKYLYTFFYL